MRCVGRLDVCGTVLRGHGVSDMKVVKKASRTRGHRSQEFMSDWTRGSGRPVTRSLTPATSSTNRPITERIADCGSSSMRSSNASMTMAPNMSDDLRDSTINVIIRLKSDSRQIFGFDRRRRTRAGRNSGQLHHQTIVQSKSGRMGITGTDQARHLFFFFFASQFISRNSTTNRKDAAG